jgi:hypothetical protein
LNAKSTPQRLLCSKIAETVTVSEPGNLVRKYLLVYVSNYAQDDAHEDDVDAEVPSCSHLEDMQEDRKYSTMW